MTLTMPLQRPGQSRQDYGTPRDLIRSVELKFGAISWDLAATADNAKAGRHINPVMNSLAIPWGYLPGLLWLNPPFARIGPWARKCHQEGARGGRILLLVPASTGTAWFQDHVHNRALIYFLKGRLSFDGAIGHYPKDCLIAAYGFKRTGYDVWDWRETLKSAERAA